MHSRIAGTGRYLPSRILTNKELEAMVDTSDEWIRSHVGICQRHIAGEDETVSSMSEIAARRALEMADLKPQDIDLIVMGTMTPDQVFPNSAVIMQERLGIQSIPAFTIEAACSGFIYALSIAEKFIRLGEAKHALVLGAEKIAPLVNWHDRNTCILFGDGAAAIVLSAAEVPGILDTQLRADGQYQDLLYFPSGPGKNFKHMSQDTIQMHGAEVYETAVNVMSELAVETLERNRLTSHDLDWLIPHQANLPIIQAVANRLDMPMDKVVVTVDQFANTSAASIPMALDVAVRDGRIQRGDLLLLESFGGGFTWGSALVRY